MAGKNGKDRDGQRAKIREPELQEYSTSHHLVEMYSTVLSSEPLTVRTVTVFHSHEVFMLHSPTSVCMRCERRITIYSLYFSCSALCLL